MPQGLCLGLVLFICLGTLVTQGLVMNRYCICVPVSWKQPTLGQQPPPPPLTGAEAGHCVYDYFVEGWMV